MRAGKQKGMALVMVLLIVAMATTIAAFMAQQQAFWQRAMENGRDRAQSRRIAEAGIDWARAVLADDASVSRYDHGQEMWAMHLPAVQLERGEIRGAIHDQQGLFNLNNLVRNGVVSQSDLLHYQRLLDTLGMPQDLATTLLDWLDANNEPGTNGAEDDFYFGQQPPYRCANRLLSDIGELAWVKGYDGSIIKRLQPYVSVLPESGTPVNVNFAPPEVMVAVIPGLALQEARRIHLQIQSAPFKSTTEFFQQVRAQRSGSENLTVNSQYFMVTGYATQGDGESSVHALLKRTGIWAQQIRKSLQ
jgi:general secretion pathway protein K